MPIKSKKYYRREATSKGYRSKFELEIAKWLEKEGISFKYEPCKLDYIVPESKHKYTPDWQVNGDSSLVWESKGRLTAADRRKLIHVRASNPDVHILIVLQNADVKIRKGSKTSYGDWCTAAGFDWVDFRNKKGMLKWCR